MKDWKDILYEQTKDLGSTFLKTNTMKQYEDKLLTILAKEISRGKVQGDVKDVVIKVFREFYNFMWTQRGYWEPRLKNA